MKSLSIEMMLSIYAEARVFVAKLISGEVVYSELLQVLGFFVRVEGGNKLPK